MNAWLGSNPTIITAGQAQQRAAITWARIQQEPVSVVFKTAQGTPIAAQTVRIEYDNRGVPVTDSSGTAPVLNAVIYGIRQHATLPDTDIKKGYSFKIEKDNYIVRSIVKVPGEIQANCEISR